MCALSIFTRLSIFRASTVNRTGGYGSPPMLLTLGALG
jgi:hypothetical protein